MTDSQSSVLGKSVVDRFEWAMHVDRTARISVHVPHQIALSTGIEGFGSRKWTTPHTHLETSAMEVDLVDPVTIVMPGVQRYPNPGRRRQNEGIWFLLFEQEHHPSRFRVQ